MKRNILATLFFTFSFFLSISQPVISTKGNAHKQKSNFGELAPAMYALQVDECLLKIVKQ
jgi:hypothetical protein